MKYEAQVKYEGGRYKVICTCGFSAGPFDNRVPAALIKLEHQNYHIEKALDRIFNATLTTEP